MTTYKVFVRKRNIPVNKLTNPEQQKLLEFFLEQLNQAEAEKHKRNGYTFPPDKWHVGERSGRKFLHINVGGSGAFLLERDTLELYNIKGYGTPDYSKKKKADIGNLLTVTADSLITKRFNYLR